jgi:hypothetical protein
VQCQQGQLDLLVWREQQMLSPIYIGLEECGRRNPSCCASYRSMKRTIQRELQPLFRSGSFRTGDCIRLLHGAESPALQISSH